MRYDTRYKPRDREVTLVGEAARGMRHAAT